MTPRPTPWSKMTPDEQDAWKRAYLSKHPSRGIAPAPERRIANVRHVAATMRAALALTLAALVAVALVVGVAAWWE